VQDPTDSAASTTGGTTSARDSALRELAARFQALRSAWGVIAPSVVAEAKQAIAAAGRELRQELAELVPGEPCGRDPQAIAALDERLAELEASMRDVALGVSVAQLRSTLPERVGVDRRGVLCLLDLILGAEFEAADDTQVCLPTLDYVITLLCTGGDPDARLQDPVTLTPRLHALCERGGLHQEARLPELEAEFHRAAEMHEADVRTEDLRTLRRRKMELGPAFFAPRVLRAIMAYNAAMLKRFDEEVLSSQDWGVVPSEAPPNQATSVFEHSALPKLAAALRRRSAGDPPAHDPIDRIAWCLDLSYLSDPEREALLSESTGRREDLKGTTILVSLMCRAAVVLDQELPGIGIAADQLSGARISSEELARVSPFLASGKRSDEGMGTAFVGTLHGVWSELETEEQNLAAGELVEELRQRGVREIMIYDDERRLRIQALGGRSPTVIANSALRP